MLQIQTKGILQQKRRSSSFIQSWENLMMLISVKSLNYAKWFAIVLKFKGMFSILKLAATTTLYSGKSFCINGKVQLVMQVLIRLSVTVLDEERLWRHTVLSLARFLLRFLVPIYSQQRDSGLMDSAGFQSTVDVHLTATGASHSGSDDDSIVGVYPARHSALSFRGP